VTGQDAPAENIAIGRSGIMTDVIRVDRLKTEKNDLCRGARIAVLRAFFAPGTAGGD